VASFPALLAFFMASDVYGAMLTEAGHRIAASILRAKDLSFVLCSNRWLNLKNQISADNHQSTYFELETEDRRELSDAQPLIRFLRIEAINLKIILSLVVDA